MPLQQAAVGFVYGFLVCALLFELVLEGGCMGRVDDGLNGTCNSRTVILSATRLHPASSDTYRRPLVVHSAALHAHNQRKEVLVRHGGASVRGGPAAARRHAGTAIRILGVHGDARARQFGPLVLQARALQQREHGFGG